MDKELGELQTLLDEKSLSLEISDAAQAWLAKNGYDAKMGARPMARLIENEIRKPLAKLLVFEEPAAGSTIKVDIDDSAGSKHLMLSSA